jgi:hypothetical protein
MEKPTVKGVLIQVGLILVGLVVYDQYKAWKAKQV